MTEDDNTPVYILSYCSRCYSTGCRQRLCLRLLWLWHLTFWPKT